jgi:hypothetical protein
LKLTPRRQLARKSSLQHNPSLPIARKPGEPFNPFGLFNGNFIPEAICRYRALSLGAKMVYGRFCRYAGRDGTVYPSIPTLAAELGIGKTQTRTYVQELEHKHFIAVDRVNREGISRQDLDGHEVSELAAFRGVVDPCAPAAVVGYVSGRVHDSAGHSDCDPSSVPGSADHAGSLVCSFGYWSSWTPYH